jgi:hypothetical protein
MAKNASMIVTGAGNAPEDAPDTPSLDSLPSNAWLSEFHGEEAETEGGLLPAEELLLAAARQGRQCEIAFVRPEEATRINRVRAAFLRFLLLADESDLPKKGNRLEIHGAWIDGDLNLEGCKISRALWLFKCHIEGALIGRDAELETINLQGSFVHGIFCDHAQIKGGVFLSEGFEADDRVSFDGAGIAGGLVCSGSLFSNPGGDALSCLHCQIANNVFLCDGFTANGCVSFANSRIGGIFSCDGGHFKTPMAAPARPKSLPPVAADALDLQGVRISGVLRVGPEIPAGAGVIIEGSLNLRNAHVGAFADDPRSWPPAAITLADKTSIPCVITLDGFVYSDFGKRTSTDVATRKQWLLRQPPEHLGEDFRFQPFNQLAAVLREKGRRRDSWNIGYFKNYIFLRRPRNNHNFETVLSWLRFPLDWLFIEKMLGYGYRWHRLATLVVLIVFGCGLIYEKATYFNIFVPTNPVVISSPSLAETCYLYGKPAWNSSRCALKKVYPDYSSFNPYLYSLELIIPIVDTGIKREWQPLDVPFDANILGYEVQMSANVLPVLIWGEMIFAWVWPLSLIVLGLKLIRETE